MFNDLFVFFISNKAPMKLSDIRVVCEHILQDLCHALSSQRIDALALKAGTHYQVAKEMAEVEGRTILTRRYRQIFPPDKVIYITEKKIEKQVEEVFWYLNVQK